MLAHGGGAIILTAGTSLPNPSAVEVSKTTIALDFETLCTYVQIVWKSAQCLDQRYRLRTWETAKSRSTSQRSLEPDETPHLAQ
jgi:hypothetical protein